MPHIDEKPRLPAGRNLKNTITATGRFATAGEIYATAFIAPGGEFVCH
jgi:hypothetical protein